LIKIFRSTDIQRGREKKEKRKEKGKEREKKERERERGKERERRKKPRSTHASRPLRGIRALHLFYLSDPLHIPCPSV